MRQQEPSKGLLQFWHGVFGWCALRSWQADLSRLLARQCASPTVQNISGPFPFFDIAVQLVLVQTGSGSPELSLPCHYSRAFWVPFPCPFPCHSALDAESTTTDCLDKQ